MHPVRVLLVDDSVIFADTLALRLAAMPDLVVVGSWSTDDIGPVFDVASLALDVVVIDIEPAGSEAGDLVTSARGGQPQAHVVVLTGSSDERLAVAAARAGANSWVEKASSVEHLVEVVRGAVDGLSWWPPILLGAVLDGLRVDSQADADLPGTEADLPGAEADLPGTEGDLPAAAIGSLSSLEREVLLRFASRQSQATAAQELGIASLEMRALVRSVLVKLGVTSRPAAVRLAIEVAFRAATEGAPPPPYDLSSHIRRDDLPRPRFT
jgi:NarL family two-component system response regulator LiaR